MAGILALVLGLACVRVLFWVRRTRLLTRVGLSFHGPGGRAQIATADCAIVREW